MMPIQDESMGDTWLVPWGHTSLSALFTKNLEATSHKAYTNALADPNSKWIWIERGLRPKPTLKCKLTQIRNGQVHENS